MNDDKPVRVHLVVGGFPPGEPAGHDMDYVRLRLLEVLRETPRARVTVSSDYGDIARWLKTSRFLITYVAGPYPDEDGNSALADWLTAGGRWFALHGTSGGKAATVGESRRVRKMVKMAHHATLGAFFLNHPPARKFRVNVAMREHPLAAGVAPSFEVMDELYMIELQDPAHSEIFLTTELARNPAPNFGFVYDRDTSLLSDGKTRALGFTRQVGAGGVAYVALGHCHSPSTNVQPFVDESIDPAGKTPLQFRGAWETEAFGQLLRNAIKWGIAAPASQSSD
ncbi:MAG: ThuA domain-containing protein [Candidatus Binataceae bacterium]